MLHGKRVVTGGVLLALWALLLVAGSSVAAEKAAWPPHLRFLTGPNGGQWFVMGEPLAEVLTRDVLSTSSRIGGGVDNVSSVSDKRGDLGFTLNCFLTTKDMEDSPFKDIKLDNAVLMANIYPQVLYFLVRKDFAERHGITDVGSLLQQRVPLRFASLRPGTASEFILTLLLKYGYGTSFEKLREQGWSIQFNNYAETADNFVDGQIDCFAYTAGVSVPLIKTMENHTDVRILPISAEVLAKMTEKVGTTTYTIDPGDYKSVTAPLQTLGDYTCLVVRKDLPDDLVYAITESLWKNKAYIAKNTEDFGLLQPETALPPTLPAHPGSVRFWKGLGAR